MSPSYEHAATVSSQVFFCSAPIRLDSYNRCQFACTYCFSRNRALDTSLPGLRSANTDAFRARLARIAQGTVQSAFDEFLQARVPIQLGGMQDPFSPMEALHGVTQRLLEALDEFHYPTLISTKGTRVAAPPLMKMLRGMNVLVRFSAAGVRDQCRQRLEVGCPTLDELLAAMGELAQQNIPVSLRIQPVIPGHEEAALDLVERAARAGARHVSFEYLKIGTEDRTRTLERVSAATGCDVWQAMTVRGVKRLGRDYTLKTEAKIPFLVEARRACAAARIKFGAGDTEFIHLSDGVGCCNGSGLFLSRATEFRANFVGVLSEKRPGDLVHFSDLETHWRPKGNMHRYLTTNSRGRARDPALTSWMALLAHRWNGSHGPYSPAFFYGVHWTGECDEQGYKVFQMRSGI